MDIGEAIGAKNNLGYGTSIIKVYAPDYPGETVTLKDEDGETIGSKTLSAAGRAKFSIEDSGYLTVTVGDTTKKIKVTYFGVYKVKINPTVVYTLRIDESDPNPLSRCTYLDDAAGYDRAHMDFSTGNFDYGSWADAFFMPRPCMLKQDGTVDYYLDPDDYTKKEDGTASDVKNTSYSGNAMMQWPTIYTRHYKSGNYRYISVTNKATAGYNCYAHHDRNGNVTPYMYTRIYEGHVYGGKIRSLSGVTPTASNTAPNEKSYANANGAGYELTTAAQWLLVKDLAYLIGKTTNTQETFGYGRCLSTNTAAISTGTMDKKGMFWGANDQTSGHKIFGMENWWGNLWERIVGLIASATSIQIKLTYGTEDGSTTTGYNFTGSGYISTGVTMGGTSGGYISAVAVRDYGELPQTANGSETTYESDGLWFTTSGTLAAVVGGNWTHGGCCGAACVGLAHAASSAYASLGASLSYTPLAEAA